MANRITYIYKNLGNKNEFTTIDLNNEINCNLQKIKEYRSINSISSYLAMFPMEIPLYLIEKYSKKNDYVMDNFSGRGTTAIAARMMNRNFVGNDLNPYACVLTKFKISSFSINDLISRVNYLENEYNNSKNEIKIINDVNELKTFYSEETFKQLYFLKNKIGITWSSNNEIDNAILAFSLGLMHGPAKKDNDTIYFSLSMPNTISMSPKYVEKYAQKYNLKKPNINIFEKIRERIKNKYQNFLNKKDNNFIFKYWNSIEKLNFIDNNSIDLVITSPPYLSLVNYTQSNWLKLWLLGFERKNLSKEIKLSDNFKFNEYKEFLVSYLNNIYPKLKPKAKVCLIIGDTYGINLIEEIWHQIKDKVNFKFLEMYQNNIEQKNKILNMMNSRKGEATKKEFIFVLKKEEKSGR
ncbi:DNA methyltransferase [Metamycoplasma hyosynoviae]|uniref:DNA methyltransferase n=1 Tax=Metamycoplasma hyosynoviae TaxID=29559 RepID=UPI002359465F|nr:DNA methyltransferase [Metamycoplasma hyosynoviae]MDC8916676.1 DNA methyltransferase [Metamycoplasma hyosynoviae]